LTFYGAPRFDAKKTHVHESPAVMLVPLAILAVLALAGGWWAAPHLVGGPNHFDNFVAPVFAGSEAAATSEPSATGGDLLGALLGAPVIAAVLGFLLAWWFYIYRPETPAKLAAAMRAPYRLLMGKYFVDELYASVIVRPLLRISEFFWHSVDEETIDGLVNGVADGAGEAGDRLRHLNSGNTRTYAAWVVVGAVLLTTLLAWMVR
jgi:NADH-quinone oxidoreductase subunit L